jgi:glycosyltransferase involved in cell wall biosynthesis
MRVLTYNFVQPEEKAKGGGGVSTYQDNLNKALLDRGHHVISLSSGDRYAMVNRKPHLRTAAGKGGRLVRAYVMNSPVLAPAHTSFHDLDTYLASDGLDFLAADLFRRFGPIEVFHFQNLEGLTASFFEALRVRFPEARILFTAHNYNLVCPQVNLWFREQTSCEDFRDGRACVNCLVGRGPRPDEMEVRRAQQFADALGAGKLGRRVAREAMRGVGKGLALLRGKKKPRRRSPIPPANGLVVVSDHDKAEVYRAYRARNIALAQQVFDEVLTVSNRTMDVLAGFGIPRERMRNSYIGTAHAERFLTAPKRMEQKSRLHIAYLGYMRADKGFFFFMDALSALPETVAARISVTIAARFTTEWPEQHLRALSHKFGEVKLFNGFDKTTLDDVLRTVDLGIVPPLWEDNLPQVAIELVSRGIPILTSDKGGAAEIGNNPDFVFQAGSRASLLFRLANIAAGRVPLRGFWKTPATIVSMAEHTDDLMESYLGATKPEVRSRLERQTPAIAIRDVPALLS